MPVVATCGTALTIAQAQLLRRFASKTVLCYDPDAAGQGAAERSCELLVSEGFDVNVALLPGGQDPDTFVQKHGRDAYVAQLKQSKPYLEFLLDRAAVGKDLTRDDARREFLKKMLAVAGADSGSRRARPVRRSPRAQGPGHRRGRAERDSQGRGRAGRRSCRRARCARCRRRCATSRGACCGRWCTRPTRRSTSLRQLEPADLEGLRSQDVLEKALELRSPRARGVAKCPDGASNRSGGATAAEGGEPNAKPPRRGPATSCVQKCCGSAGSSANCSRNSAARSTAARPRRPGRRRRSTELLREKNRAAGRQLRTTRDGGHGTGIINSLPSGRRSRLDADPSTSH